MVRIELAVAALGLASAALAVPAKGKTTSSTATATKTKGGKGGKTTSTSSATSTATAGAGGNLDLTVLQFALTLEHLEDVFYQGALQNFTLQDFNNAGYSQDYYHNLKYIAYDEQTHVQVLETLIKAAGGTPNAPCTYDFPYTNVKSFITLSGILENVGTSAYLGAAPLITGADYLTDAGAILAVEALHTSYQRAAIGEVPNANPFQTPLDPTSAYTLASMFIVSCPKGNTKLPFTPFPYLTLNGTYGTCEQPNCGTPSQYIKRDGAYNWPSGGWPNPGNNNAAAPVQQGATITLTSAAKIPAGSYVTFISGLTVTSVKGNVNGKSISVKIPTGLSGQSYAFVTNQDVEGTFNDKAVIAGPAVVEVDPPKPALNYTPA